MAEVLRSRRLLIYFEGRANRICCQAGCAVRDSRGVKDRKVSDLDYYGEIEAPSAEMEKAGVEQG